MVAQTDMHHYCNSIYLMSDPSRVAMQFQLGPKFATKSLHRDKVIAAF